MIAGNCCRLRPSAQTTAPAGPHLNPEAHLVCRVSCGKTLCCVSLACARQARACASVCAAVCVSAILFICIINREREQNKIIDARIFRATTATSAAAAAAGINDKR